MHASGEIMRMPGGGVPWRNHLWDLEIQQGIQGAIKYVLYESGPRNWKCKAVEVQGMAFTNRVSLPKAWRGLRDGELDKESGIPGGTFVHVAGFLGGGTSYETVFRMAIKSLNMAREARP